MGLLLRRELVVHQSRLPVQPLDVVTSGKDEQVPVLAADAAVAVLDRDVVSWLPCKERAFETEPDGAAVASACVEGVFWYGVVVETPDEGFWSHLLGVWGVGRAGHLEGVVLGTRYVVRCETQPGILTWSARPTV